jgi:hypothetical protein
LIHRYLHKTKRKKREKKKSKPTEAKNEAKDKGGRAEKKLDDTGVKGVARCPQK